MSSSIHYFSLSGIDPSEIHDLSIKKLGTFIFSIEGKY